MAKKRYATYKRVTKSREYRFWLSENDEYVPDNYLSLTEIFTNPNCRLPGFTPEEWCIGKKKLKELRREIFKATLIIMRTTKVERFDVFWNGNIDAINQSGINEFVKFPFFIELASVMMAFQTNVETKWVNVNSKRKIISFGIRKTLYRKYYDSLMEAYKNGTEPKPVNLYDPKKRKRNDVFSNTQQTTLVFQGVDSNHNHYVELNKNEIFLAYERWCKLNRRTKKDGLYLAMLYIMKQFPCEEMDSLEDIRAKIKKNDKLQPVDIKSRDKYEKKRISIDAPMFLYDNIVNIIDRYNRDLENVGKKRITIMSFCQQALIYYIKNLPLKYTNPDMYREYMNAKEAAEYNESL